MIFSFFMYR